MKKYKITLQDGEGALEMNRENYHEVYQAFKRYLEAAEKAEKAGKEARNAGSSRYHQEVFGQKLLPRSWGRTTYQSLLDKRDDAEQEVLSFGFSDLNEAIDWLQRCSDYLNKKYNVK